MEILKKELTKTRGEAEVARKFFSNLVRDSGEVRESVRRIDLDGPVPGAPHL